MARTSGWTSESTSGSEGRGFAQVIRASAALSAEPGARRAFCPALLTLHHSQGVAAVVAELPSPAGLPHLGHMVCLDSISPVKTWVFLAFSSMSSFIFWARAADTSTASRGASSTHSPASSFQSLSHTNFLQRGHLLKCPFASLPACSKACSCSLCHSGVMPSKRSPITPEPVSAA